MATHTASTLTRWQDELIHAITEPEELLDILNLDKALLTPAQSAAKQFSLKVPRALLSRIQKGNINDPILKQILPLGVELDEQPGYTSDPLGEKFANPVPGLLHKYKSRVLLTLTSVCGVNCRYCFRRQFPYAQNNPGTAGWDKALEYIAQDTSIHEVILSGGDPLIVSDHLLQQFSQKLATIPHIKRLRIHTRMPIVIPSRVTPEFVSWLKDMPFQPIIVTHINHPQEIDDAVKNAMSLLRSINVTLLNQSVLLKGVNDSVDILVELSEKLFATGILPYYLHVLDKITGAAHFDLERERAIKLHNGVSDNLSGFLVPKLVCEQVGANAKIPISATDFYTG